MVTGLSPRRWRGAPRRPLWPTGCATLPQEGALVLVEDPLPALHRLAAWWRTQLRGRVIAVTGSSGKSQVKDALVHLLAQRFDASGSIGSYNSQLGVPLSVLALARDIDFAVIEAAVSAPGEMDLLAPVVRPDFGLLTNLNPSGTPLLPTAQALAQEDLKLFADLPPDGWLLLPGFVALDSAGPSIPIRRCGGDEDGGPVLANWRAAGPEVHGTLRFPSGSEYPLLLHATSLDTVPEIQLAVAAAYLLGVQEQEIVAALAAYAPAHTRREIWRTPTGVTLINDSYSGDALSTRASLRALTESRPPGGRAWFVLTETSRPEAEHARVAAMAAEQGVDVLVLLGDGEAEASEFQRLAPNRSVLHCARAEELAEVLGAQLRPGDAVLVQGPLGSGIDMVAREISNAMAQTRLIVDVRALAANVAQFRRVIGPRTKLLGMVKALAYGSALVGMGAELMDLKLDSLGVSTADEGIALRAGRDRRSHPGNALLSRGSGQGGSV